MSEQKMQDNQTKCAQEIEAVLKKYNFSLQIQPPMPVLVPNQEQKVESKVLKP